jgi:hypothetical protein
MAQERRAAPERRATPRDADSRRSPARPTRTAKLSQAGTVEDPRRPAGAARAGQIRRDAEHTRDARTVTERHADTGTRVTQPSGEPRRRPASAANSPTGGTPKVTGEARASGRPAPTHNAGRADGRPRDSGRPQPPSRPVARRTGTARQSRGLGEIISATLRRARAALRWLVARPDRAVRRMVRRLSSRVTVALRDLAGRGGGAQRAAVAAVRAVLAGRNPVVAAMKAWFAAMSTPMKILVVVGLVLLALLAPLLLLLLLLALAVAVVVIVVRRQPPSEP